MQQILHQNQHNAHHADNNELKVGDTIDDGEKSWKITGLVALSDYSCLFQNNSDTMFDSVKFGVGVVTEEEFDTLNQDKLQYNYAWIYNEKPQTELEEKEVSISNKFMLVQNSLC